MEYSGPFSLNINKVIKRDDTFILYETNIVVRNILEMLKKKSDKIMYN